MADLDAGGSVRATWDASGLPRHLVLDPIPNAIDDELDVTIDAVRADTHLVAGLAAHAA